MICLSGQQKIVTHWLLVIGWDTIDETTCQKKKHGYSLSIGHEMRHDGWVWLAKKLLLTGYWSWDETCVCLPKKKKSRATHCLLFMRYDYLIRLSTMKKCSVTHCLMEEHYMISKSAWKKKRNVTHTLWPWDEKWLTGLPAKTNAVTHPLLVMGWDIIDEITCWIKMSATHPLYGIIDETTFQRK